MKKTWPVGVFLTKRYHRVVKAVYKTFERRQKKCFAPACLISAMDCRSPSQPCGIFSSEKLWQSFSLIEVYWLLYLAVFTLDSAGVVPLLGACCSSTWAAITVRTSSCTGLAVDLLTNALQRAFQIGYRG